MANENVAPRSAIEDVITCTACFAVVTWGAIQGLSRGRSGTEIQYVHVACRNILHDRQVLTTARKPNDGMAGIRAWSLVDGQVVKIQTAGKSEHIRPVLEVHDDVCIRQCRAAVSASNDKGIVPVPASHVVLPRTAIHHVCTGGPVQYVIACASIENVIIVITVWNTCIMPTQDIVSTVARDNIRTIAAF